MWANNFAMVRRRIDAAGATVINAAPDSRITAFARMSIDEALANVQAA
jgi:hypothetical protein